MVKMIKENGRELQTLSLNSNPYTNNFKPYYYYLYNILDSLKQYWLANFPELHDLFLQINNIPELKFKVSPLLAHQKIIEFITQQFPYIIIKSYKTL